MPVFNKMVYNGTEYILGGGGNIGEPLNLTVTTSGLDATITWEDNEIGTIPPTTFQKSELVRKIGSAPTSPSDGDLVVTETVKDTYKVSGYVDQGLTDGETYYYRVFSYSDLGGISYCDAVSVIPRWLPITYQQVEYIESSGLEYIDTNLEGKNDYIVNAKILFTDLVGTSTDCCVIGSRGNRPNYMYLITKVGYNGHKWGIMLDGDYTNRRGSVSANTEYEVTSTVKTSGNSLVVNNSTVGSFSYSSTYDNGYDLWMFGANVTGSLGNPFIGRIYYMKIQDGSGNQLRNYIPCYRIADGEIGMYDVINGVFYTNDGTGAFTKGPDTN